MRIYVATTGLLFALLTVVHIWRAIAEGTQLLRQPWYVLITLVMAALALWAARLLRSSAR